MALFQANLIILFLFRTRLAGFFGLNLGLGQSGFLNALLETLHSTGGVHQFLLAGIKRMALAADFSVDFLNGRAGGKSIAASAFNYGVGIKLWVDGSFHNEEYGLILVGTPDSI